MTARCKKCAYYSGSAGGTCDYIGYMHQSRPCPTGDECTVFELAKAHRQRSLPSISGKNGRRKPPAEPDLLDYINALDTALAAFGEV